MNNQVTVPETTAADGESQPTGTRPGSRRQLLLLAGASAAGVVAASSRPGSVAAADPNDVVKNISNVVDDTTTLDGSHPGPTFSLFNRNTTNPASALYTSSSAADPTVRADNDFASGIGGVGIGGNAPGGRDLAAIGSGRIAMNDHDFGNSEAYSAGELHQSGGTVYAMVSPTVRREVVGPASAGALHPITPTRVYDSRRPAPAFGRLGPGETRVISVANGRDLETGGVLVPGLVPAGATAIQYNITVVGTLNAGFLYVSPADATAISASTINWVDDQTVIGNSSMVKLSGDRQIRVWCSDGASTDFIIDVLGYYS